MQKMVNETKKVFGDKEKKKKHDEKNQIQDIQNDIRDGINFDINKQISSNDEQNENQQSNDVVNFNTTDVIPISNNNTNNNNTFPYILERTNQSRDDLITFENDINTNTLLQPPTQQSIDNFFSNVNSQCPPETSN